MSTWKAPTVSKYINSMKSTCGRRECCIRRVIKYYGSNRPGGGGFTTLHAVASKDYTLVVEYYRWTHKRCISRLHGLSNLTVSIQKYVKNTFAWFTLFRRRRQARNLAPPINVPSMFDRWPVFGGGQWLALELDRVGARTRLDRL